MRGSLSWQKHYLAEDRDEANDGNSGSFQRADSFVFIHSIIEVRRRKIAGTSVDQLDRYTTLGMSTVTHSTC